MTFFFIISDCIHLLWIYVPLMYLNQGRFHIMWRTDSHKCVNSSIKVLKYILGIIGIDIIELWDKWLEYLFRKSIKKYLKNSLLTSFDLCILNAAIFIITKCLFVMDFVWKVEIEFFLCGLQIFIWHDFREKCSYFISFLLFDLIVLNNQFRIVNYSCSLLANWSCVD